jgi:hypothetical protein
VGGLSVGRPSNLLQCMRAVLTLSGSAAAAAAFGDKADISIRLRRGSFWPKGDITCLTRSSGSGSELTFNVFAN